MAAARASLVLLAGTLLVQTTLAIYLSPPSECGSVFLTISALEDWPFRNPNKENLIELNWDLSQCSNVPESQIPNQIALYKSDPTISNDSIPLTAIFIKDHKWGYHVTDIPLGQIFLKKGRFNKLLKYRTTIKAFPLKTSNAICLPFWIAAFKDNQLLKSNCLKLQPTWMGDIKYDIADMKLSHLIIPGTHNAGSYQFQSMFQLFRSNLIERFTLCQGMDIYTQLAFGVRYLDFRISYQTLGSEKLWLSHGMVKVRPLIPILEDIKRFLQITKDEIVILDIHQLPAGFYDSDNTLIASRHNLLIETLVKMFSDYIVDYDALMNSVEVVQGPKVSDIWNTGKKLIIGYPENRVIQQNKWLWPAVSHMWGNTNDPYELKKYLDRVMSSVSRPSTLWSAMAQTTPTPMDVVFSDKSLRKMADAVNRNLTRWLQYEWYGKANIVSSDFFMGNNVIDLAVYYNSVKGQLKKTQLGKLMFSY